MPEGEGDSKAREHTRQSPSKALVALLLLAPAPSIGAAAALVLWKGNLGQAIWIASKVWLVAFPAAWLLLVDRGRLRVSKPKLGGLVQGALWGAAIGVAIIAAWFSFGKSWVDAEKFTKLADEAGFASKWIYAGLFVYWAGVNSLLEEYVWRWFVFGKCRALLGNGVARRPAAIVLSAALFTAHHIVAMGAQFDSGVTALGCSGVFAGGVIWAWLYSKWGQVWPCYISHIVADVAVFWIGWQLLF